MVVIVGVAVEAGDTDGAEVVTGALGAVNTIGVMACPGFTVPRECVTHGIQVNPFFAVGAADCAPRS